MRRGLKKCLKWGKWLGLALVAGGLALGLSVKTYLASLNRGEVRISELGQAGHSLCNTGGYFTTKSGYHYCFLFKDSLVTYNQAITDCKTYGQLAKLTDGEIKQDLLDIISQYNVAKQWLIDKTGLGTGGPVIFDECSQLTAKFSGSDTSLYYDYDGGEGVDCSAPYLILDKQNGVGGRFNDTNGEDIFGGLCQMTATPARPDYCSSASADKATMNPGETLTLSSSTNTPVNGFFYATYNLDNLYGPGNPKPVCVGTGTDPQCPNGGKPLVFSDPNNTTIASQGLRTSGSVPEIPYANLFVTDKSTGQQAKNLQFNAYFSLNGGPWSLPKPNCVAYTKMSASLSPSPSPSSSPGTNQAGFVIHKFLDANKNGVREAGEGTTNRTWEFEYQIDGGEKQSYTIEPDEEEGEKIIVNKGVKVKVAELGQEGWLNTTGAELTKTLADPKLYTFYFGNWPVGGAAGGTSPIPTFPPTQPDTGTPTWITVGAVAMGAILLTAKLLLRL